MLSENSLFFNVVLIGNICIFILSLLLGKYDVTIFSLLGLIFTLTLKKSL